MSWYINPSSTLIAIVVVLVFHVVLRRHIKRAQRRPPGPRGLPIIGNALQIPKEKQWLKFEQWRRDYGDIVFVSVMRQPTVILGSFQAANDLLDVRGMIYSDRPPAPMAGELVGWSRGLGYSPGPPNPRFRAFRRLFHASVGPRAIPTLTSALEHSTQMLLLRLLRDGGAFAKHARESTGALILSLAYGYTADDALGGAGDPLVQIAEDAMHGFARASEPGWAVDSFPFLKHVPAWFPGAGFKREARTMRSALERLYDVPFAFVKDQIAKGKAVPSFTSTFLEEKGGEATEEDEEFVKAAAASLYSGGAETTPSALTSLLLALTLYPDVQARAHTEIDTLPGQRLPTLDDREHLPYVDALVRELWRWNPSVPLGLPHMATQDDVYRGYTIKAGTVVWANIWSMLHDETIFPSPHDFRPERFLDTHGRPRALSGAEDAGAIAFGFGRRECPGRALAEASVFLASARVLYAFEVSEVSAGRAPKVEYEGFISHPKLFECRIVPRSAGVMPVESEL